MAGRLTGAAAAARVSEPGLPGQDDSMRSAVSPLTGPSLAASREHRKGLGAVLIAAVLWSTGGLFIKWVDLDALAITMWRSLLAGATLWLLMRPPWVAPWRAGGRVWALALSYAVMLLLFVVATRLTTAASAIFLQYTAPLYVLVLGTVFLDERPSRLDTATVLTAFGGMLLFFVGKLEADDLWGNLCAIGSGMGFAIFLVLMRAPGTGVHTRPQAMVLGNALLFVGLLAVNGGRGQGFAMGAGDAAALVFLGVVQIGAAYWVFSYGIAQVRVLEASLIGMLEPVLNPVWVFIFLGESPGWWAVAGGAIIIAAVSLRMLLTERGRTAAPVAHPEARPATGHG